MAGTLETATRELFEALDRKDADAVIRATAKDAQGVDEISRRWMRGVDELSAYFRQTMQVVDDIHSTVNDTHEAVYGDVGLVTCWLEQDYTLEGKRTHVSAPTTIGYRRDGADWKVILIHTVPLQPEEA